MADPNKTQPAKKRRWASVLLFVSLSLNLLVVGVVVGAFFRPSHGGGSNGPPISMRPDLGLGPYGQALSPADRRVFRQVLRENAQKSAGLMPKLENGLSTALVALRQDPFDIEAVRQIIGAQQSQITGAQNASRDRLLDHLAAMDRQTRLSYADRLEKVVTRRRR